MDKKNRRIVKGTEVGGAADVMTSTNVSGNFFYKVGSVSYGNSVQ